jgi:hypothetical protein
VEIQKHQRVLVQSPEAAQVAQKLNPIESAPMQYSERLTFLYGDKYYFLGEFDGIMRIYDSESSSKAQF